MTAPSMDPPSDDATTPLTHDIDDAKGPPMDVVIHFNGKQTPLPISEKTSLNELSEILADLFSVEVSKQKIMITPKGGLFRPPFPETPVSSLYNPRSKITLLGSTAKEISDLSSSIAKAKLLTERRLTARREAPKANRYRDWQKIQDESAYTFHSIKPLPYLPNPERSQQLLERLAQDPGIKTAMRTHKFSVGLLTEMNPAEHTTMESRTLGLNRNNGQAIELRLRTDRYDGYRNYKIIRKTLCHELAHNVHSEHDRKFWDLTAQIEKEVERGDWKHGGHRVGEADYYDPEEDGVHDEGGHVDEGGWTGGEFVLGGDPDSSGTQPTGLSRREILARAAMARVEEQQKPNEEMGDQDSHGSKGP